MRKYVMFSASARVVGVVLFVLGLCSGAFAQSGNTLDYGASRQEAVKKARDRYEDRLLQIRKEERANQAKYEERLVDCGSDSDCRKKALEEFEKERKVTTKERIEAKKQYDDEMDAIGRHYDRLGDSATNRYDGRDGRRYVDKVPKPNKQAVYPTRIHLGRFEVKLPDGRWVPGTRLPDGRWVPAGS